MQKIYLLLRNNNQLGPFTIEELLDQELLPSDLVWIEGKSLAWSYASELNLLRLARSSGEGVHRPPQGPSHSSVHSAPHGRRKHHRFKKSDIVPPPSPEQRPRPAAPLTPAPMSSAFSAGDVERKAEELRQRALAAERSFHHRHPTPAETHYQPDLIGAMENDIEVVYHKKNRLDIPFPQILVGGMVIAMLVAGWYGKPLFRQKVDTVDATATPLVSTQENAAVAPYKPDPVPAVVIDTAAVADSTQGAGAQPSLAAYTPGGGSAERTSAQPRAEIAQQAVMAETTAADKPPVVQPKAEPEQAVAKEPEKTTPIVVTAKKEESQAEPAASVNEDSKEKKRGFLKGLFKKKKNRDGDPDEEAGAGDSGAQNN